MSRDTCRRLLELGYKTDKEEHELTTLDLELMKMKTGIEVGGDCEMRMVWKYNELKPRFYTSPPDYLEGHMFDCTDSPFLQVLVDVGCVEKIEPIEEWVEVCETNRRLFRKYLQGHKSAFRCRYLSFCPDWFDDLFTSKYYSPIHDMV